ncbi:hypothetical protein O3M35_011290 [Rhynocoris fuscipes]|uniref:Uncharacterized protein n=1 Tax=Rhynocoris fuscipes TaxID=488301 RepID=A0AAW1CUJ0_9HEMI
MAIVMSVRSKIVVAVIVVTFVLAAMLVVASTAGWFHSSHQPMPAPHPLQHPYLKVPYVHPFNIHRPYRHLGRFLFF